MSWEDLKIPMLVSSIVLFAIALYSFILRKWKYRARVGDYPFLHGLESRKVTGVIKIKFELPYKDRVEINILDEDGSVIRDLKNELFNEGVHSISFDTEVLSAGSYYYQLISSRQKNTKRFDKV